jgi:hypothetical protein
MHDVDEFLRRGTMGRFGRPSRIDHMLADVIFDHLRDETVQRAAAGGGLLKHGRAFVAALDSPFNGRKLAAHPLDAIQELRGYFQSCLRLLRRDEHREEIVMAASFTDRMLTRSRLANAARLTAAALIPGSSTRVFSLMAITARAVHEWLFLLWMLAVCALFGLIGAGAAGLLP